MGLFLVLFPVRRTTSICHGGGGGGGGGDFQKYIMNFEKNPFYQHNFFFCAFIFSLLDVGMCGCIYLG